MAATDITCPTCGTVSWFEELNRDASAFCRACDYPLFWVQSTRLAGPEEASGDTGLRRLPGTAGRVAVATLDCPACTEPNPVTGSICIRCGASLQPAPPPEPVYQPPPPPAPIYIPPAPVPVKRRIWPWLLLAALAIAGIVVLVVLLAT